MYGKTQKEVNKKIAELKVKLNKGYDISGKNRTFNHWCELWLEKVYDTLTDERYHTQKKRLQPFQAVFGYNDIADIKTADIERIIKDIERSNPRTRKPTAKKTLVEYRGVVASVFDYAVQNRVIDFNPTKYIAIPKTAKKSIREPINDTDIMKIRKSNEEMTLAISTKNKMLENVYI